MTIVRRFLQALRELPDRLTHGARHAAALERLRDLPAPRAILVVCHGNLCRSPYAAAALRRACESAKITVQVASAGFVGPQRQPPAEAIAAAASRGATLESHRSRLIGREMIDAADLVVVMDSRQAAAVSAPRLGARRVVVLADLDPESTARAIRDPFGQVRAAFDECYERIDRCVAELVRGLAEGR